MVGGGREKQKLRKSSDLKFRLEKNILIFFNSRTASRVIPSQMSPTVKHDNLSISWNDADECW